MSQTAIINNKVFPSFSVVQSITGSIGGAVFPDVFNNINLLGGINIQVVGTPLTNTLAIALGPNITVTSVTAGDFYTDTVTAHMNILSNSIVAAGTDADIDIEIRPKGTGDLNVSNGSIRIDAFGIGVVLSDNLGVLSSLTPAIAAGRALMTVGGVAAPTWQAIAPGGIGVVLSNASGVLNSLTPGILGTVLTSNGAALAPTWQIPTGGGLTWSGEAGTPVAMVADHGYVNQNAGLTTFTLPAVAAFGTFMEIVGEGAGGWTISQGAGQSIQFGNVSTTIGVGGSLSSTNRYDVVTIFCRVANTTWEVDSNVGILNVI